MNISRINNLSFLFRSHGKVILRHGMNTYTSKKILPKEVFRYQVHSVSTYEVKDVIKEDGLVVRILNKIPFLNTKTIRIKAVGFLLYESIADQVDYFTFFEEFHLPDTFYSWFVVTELYIWMFSARAMAEGKEGQILRNSIVEALWADVTQRAANPAAMRHHVSELSEQFQASMIAYDEGLQSDDIVLAGALWRRMYQMEVAHPEHLEKLVKQIRKQIVLLDNISIQQLFKDKTLKWEPIRN